MLSMALTFSQNASLHREDDVAEQTEVDKQQRVYIAI